MNAYEIKTRSVTGRSLKAEITYDGDRIDVHDALLKLADHIVQTLDAVNHMISNTESNPLPAVVHLRFSQSVTTTNTTNMWPKDVF